MFEPRASRGRRRHSALAAAGACLLLIPTMAASPAAAVEAPSLPVGLFGTQDTSYDFVYRQSLALLAYAAEDVEPPAEAVEWLLDQQCDNGAFLSFREDTTKPCLDADPVSYAGPDTNNTAIAVQALGAWGEDDAAEAGLEYLEAAQNDDGGIPYVKGVASDSNSTGLAAMAVSAAGLDPADATAGSGKSLTDALDGLQVDCTGDPSEIGAYDYQLTKGGLVANDKATVQALTGRAGAALPFITDDAAAVEAPRLDCGSGGTDDPTTAAAGYLAQRLIDNDGTIPAAGGTEWGDTRWAVIALAAAGYGRNALIEAFTALAENQDKYLADAQGEDRPGALAELILAAYAAKPSVEAGVGKGAVSRQTVVLGVNTESLLERLEATLNAAPVEATPTPTPTPESGSDIPATDATKGGTELADTGASSTRGVASALALIALGAGLITVSRRRWFASA